MGNERVSSSSSTKSTSSQKFVYEGDLMQRSHGLLGRMKGADWCKHHFRVDGERGVLESWKEGGAGPSKPSDTFLLDHLLIVAQPKGTSRELQLTFGGRPCRGRHVLDLRVPEDCDFLAWLS